MRRFLVIQTAFLGDAVLATALLEKLRAFHPDAVIDLVVRKGNEGLFDGHPFLNQLHIWDKRSGKTRDLFRLIGALRKTEYDHIINCQRFLSTGLMTVLARGKEKIGYDKNPLSFLFTRKVKHVIGDGRHEADRLNELIEHLTDGSRPLPCLYPAEKHKAEAGPSSPYVCIAPASVWFTKQWPEQKWIELIRALPAEQRVLLIGAPGDAPLCERIATAAGRGDVLAGKISLLGTAALMHSAMMNYVNDSAPLHIASAMNAPVTAIFCSTVPAFGFGPLRKNGRVLETREQLDCRPCGLHGHSACPKGHFKCAMAISTVSVVGNTIPTPREFDLEASVTFMRSDEGGRRRPAFNGYTPTHQFKDHEELNDGEHFYPNAGQMAPGETGIVMIQLKHPERNHGALQEGISFSVQEGNHVIGTGRIIRVLNPRLQF